MKLNVLLSFLCVLILSYIVFAYADYFQLNQELTLAVNKVTVQEENIRSLKSKLASLNTPEALINNSHENYISFDAIDNAYLLAAE